MPVQIRDAKEVQPYNAIVRAYATVDGHSDEYIFRVVFDLGGESAVYVDFGKEQYVRDWRHSDDVRIAPTTIARIKSAARRVTR